MLGHEHGWGRGDTMMRVMIISTDYGPFLKSLYDPNRSFFQRLFGPSLSLRNESHDEQLWRRNLTLFAGSDFYSSNFRALGHEAWEFHVNNGPLQSAWLKDRGQTVGGRPPINSPLR